MKEEEKLEYCAARKEVGASLWKAGRVNMALKRYANIVQLLAYIDGFQEENKPKAKDIKKSCELNKALCQLKLENFVEAKKTCVAVLSYDAENKKALFRRAQADFQLANYEDCIRELKQLATKDPQDKDVRTLLKRAQAAQKEEDRKAKATFAKMCGNTAPQAREAPAPSQAAPRAADGK